MPSDRHFLEKSVIKLKYQKTTFDGSTNNFRRIGNWGSVFINELLTIKRYSYGMHLASKDKNRLRCDRTAVNLIRALFPSSKIAGSTKIRCMEIIEQPEPPRSI
ncbi:chorismate-binding protein [Fortiea contorta]|uniref:chorismate-binding protein n=1 Tax=Fortiea contorta TaxID=1892405 RepID=UPI00034DB8DF|nr:chorismate-binding protein [Fortiea contorta]